MPRLSGSFRFSTTVLLLALGIMVCVFEVDSAGQIRLPRRPDPQTQLLNNYRKYPDRYIRISNEAWRYNNKSHIAFHSFTLKNIAGVAYAEIEIRLKYLSADGKTLQSQVLKIPGILAAYQTKKINELKVRNAPEESDQVLATIEKASIHP
jgi:hypothetical protein